MRNIFLIYAIVATTMFTGLSWGRMIKSVSNGSAYSSGSRSGTGSGSSWSSNTGSWSGSGSGSGHK